MKTLLTISTLVFTILLPAPGHAEWTKVGENVSGDTYYIDFDRIRKHDGYVYYWELADYLKPSETGTLSNKQYNQGDCKLFRFKTLSFIFYKQAMGEGNGESYSPENPPWDYPPPQSVMELVLKLVCKHAEKMP